MKTTFQGMRGNAIYNSTQLWFGKEEESLSKAKCANRF